MGIPDKTGSSNPATWVETPQGCPFILLKHKDMNEKNTKRAAIILLLVLWSCMVYVRADGEATESAYKSMEEANVRCTKNTWGEEECKFDGPNDGEEYPISFPQFY